MPGGGDTNGVADVFVVGIMANFFDADDDGMDDRWESLVPQVTDAGADPDTDGLTNLQEFLPDRTPTVPRAGTPPRARPASLPDGIALANPIRRWRRPRS